MNCTDLSQSRADFHISNWAAWTQSYRVRLGYPGQSPMFVTGGLSTEDSFDELCGAADEHAAKVSDAIISGLRADLQAAITHHYLAAVLRIKGDLQALLQEARERFWQEAERRGLC